MSSFEYEMAAHGHQHVGLAVAEASWWVAVRRAECLECERWKDVDEDGFCRPCATNGGEIIPEDPS